jgi:2-oxoisovalerate dehydrogenase E2 component (dihydrolipoyl transacylase)
MALRDFELPDLGEGLTEAQLVRWLVATGDRVAVDQPVAEVSTAKAEVQVPTPFAGVVRALHGEPGETIEVGRPLITVELETAVKAPTAANTAAGTEPEPGEAAASAEAAPRPASAAGEAPDKDGGAAEPAAVPAAGSPTEAETGSGGVLVGYGTSAASQHRRRRVTPADLQRHLGGATAPAGPALTSSVGAPPRAALSQAETEPPQRVPLSAQRRTAAERLTRSHAEIPAATAWVAADASRLLALRDLVNSRQNTLRVTPLAVLLRLTAAALQRFPTMNAAYDPERGEAVLSAAVHLGVATRTERGLLVPVIRDAHGLSIAAIAAELERLGRAARDGSITAHELRGSTFTVSNFGGLGADSGIALINPPEAAVLGCGRIAPRPWVDADTVVVRPVIELSLSFDHRISDGADAAGFLRYLGDLVENPALVLAEV